MIESHSAVGFILGGLAFFMFGMTLASEHLQKLAANRVRNLLNKVSSKKYLAIIIGILLTLLLQSSGAVTSMLVGLGTAEVVTLRQVMGLIVGTAIGSTFTVQLISFNILQWGLPIFVVGFCFYFITKKRVLKSISGVMVGFGLLFWGLEMMSTGTHALKDIPLIVDIFKQLGHSPFMAFLVTTLFTAFVHSSAVTLGFAMSLATSGIITFEDSLYWIYGANIGTTATALMASVGGNYIGRQVAWSHFFYKAITILIFSLFTPQIAEFFMQYHDSAPRMIANAHTLLNVVAAVLFYPLIDFGARLIERIFPRSAEEKEFGTEYINLDTYDNTDLAIAQARREILRMGDIVQTMIKDSVELFKGDDPELLESIRTRDNQLDLLHKEIKLFLVNLSERGEQVGGKVFRLISFVSDLESAGDVIDNGIVELAHKKQNLKLEFSTEGWKEIKQMHSQVVELASMTMSCFQLQDKDLALKVIEKKREIRKLERKFKESHIHRLNEGLSDSVNTSSIHLDLLNDYRRVVGLLSNHAYPLSDQPR